MANGQQKPPFSMLYTDEEFVQAPPFSFQGVTVRLFPLRADQEKLSAFCKSYLDIPAEVSQFDLVFPLVYLAVLNYGKMSPKDTRSGWVSQHEVVFLVPLAQRRHGEGNGVGNPRFIDWAWITPYIFVDDEISLRGGREFYGWEKIPSRIRREVNPWVGHPREPSRLMTLEISDQASMKDEEKQWAPLLEIHQQASPSLSVFAYDWTDPFLGMPKAALDLAAQAWDRAAFFLGPLFRGERSPLAPEEWYKTVIAGLKGMMLPAFLYQQQGKGIDRSLLGEVGSSKQITVKTFPDAKDPSSSCYEAIIQSPMTITKYHKGGLLGEGNLLGNDPTGGFSINLYLDSLGRDIMENLGLDDKQRGQRDGREIVTLQPFSPLWAEVDMEYGGGTTLCWRKDTTGWFKGLDQQHLVPSKNARPRMLGAEESPPKPRYKGAFGGSRLVQPSGPAVQTMRIEVYPLLAKGEEMKECKAYIQNLDLMETLEIAPCGSYVYMIVLNSLDKDAGRWIPQEVSFSFPVLYGDKKNVLKNIALFSPYIFVSTESSAIVDREWVGRSTMDAKLERFGGPLGGAPGDTQEALLTLATEVIPWPKQDLQVREQELFKVYQGSMLPAGASAKKWERIAREWGARVLKDHKGKIEKKQKASEDFIAMKLLVPELLKKSLPIANLTLKQFRDVEDREKACYQAIVQSWWKLEQLLEVKEIEELTHIGIHRYLSPKIVEKLGLEVKWTDDETGEIPMDHLQAIRPFSIQGEIRRMEAVNLCERIGTLTWEPTPEGKKVLEKGFEGPDIKDEQQAYEQRTYKRPPYLQRAM
jgi:hypothetical protein